MRVGWRGDTGCQKRPGKRGSGGQGGGGSPGRAPLPRARIPSPRCRVRGTKCADGRSRWAGGAWRARGSPRLGFPTLWRSSSRDTRPPTLRWALVRGRLQAPEAKWALRAAPGQGTQPPRAVPDPESPHPPRGGGWMARGLLSTAQLGCLLRVPYGGLGGGGGGRAGGTPGEFVPLPRSVVGRSFGLHAGGQWPRSPGLLHPYGLVSGMQALICLQALEPGRGRVCNLQCERMARPSPPPPLRGRVCVVEGHRWWWFQGMLRPHLPFLSPGPLSASHRDSLVSPCWVLHGDY